MPHHTSNSSSGQDYPWGHSLEPFSLTNNASASLNTNTRTLPEPRNLQPDTSRQLPGINSFAPYLNTSEHPASDFSWGSFEDDNVFDSDFWPHLENIENSQLDIDFNNGFGHNYYVDLTADAPSPPAMPCFTRKRRASGTAREIPASPSSRNSKRLKVENPGLGKEKQEVEHLDLVDIDDDGGLSKVLQQQSAAAIKAQQGPQGEVPTKMANVQCIICMEPMTDMTVTHCGHIFCHTCIMEALIAGENQGEPGKGTSKCPVCRKKVARPKEKSRDKRDVIPLEIKFIRKSTSDKGKAKA
ncbi:MAG: hypothetical protein Q9169_001026 [Polycauliona sp. 2 TL-2023]